jgi:hypothetical protein
MSLKDLLAKREAGQQAQQPPVYTPAPPVNPQPAAAAPASGFAALFGAPPQRPGGTIAQPQPAQAQLATSLQPGVSHQINTQQPQIPAQRSAPQPAAPAPFIPPASDTAGIMAMDLSIINDVATWPNDPTQQMGATDAEQMRSLLNNLSQLLGSDAVSDALLRTMQFLEQHPDCRAILMPEDIGLCVKALQASHGVILSEKVNNSTKRGAQKQKVAEETAALMDLGFGEFTL